MESSSICRAVSSWEMVASAAPVFSFILSTDLAMLSASWSTDFAENPALWPTPSMRPW